MVINIVIIPKQARPARGVIIYTENDVISLPDHQGSLVNSIYRISTNISRDDY